MFADSGDYDENSFVETKQKILFTAAISKSFEKEKSVLIRILNSEVSFQLKPVQIVKKTCRKVLFTKKCKTQIVYEPANLTKESLNLITGLVQERIINIIKKHLAENHLE